MQQRLDDIDIDIDMREPDRIQVTRHAGRWSGLAVVGCALAAWTMLQSQSAAPSGRIGPVRVDTVAVPLNPEDPAQSAIGTFTYAGGLAISSTETDQVHGLSDVIVRGDRLTAISDFATRFDARLVFEAAGRLAGLADAVIAPLIDENGGRLVGKAEGDSEGLTELPNGDYLVSFEQHHRVLLYPAGGGTPRRVASPVTPFPPNRGMEAIGARPDDAPDAYSVIGEDPGVEWMCRVSRAACTEGRTIEREAGFDVTALRRLPGGRTAYLLRAWDEARGNRITVRIVADGDAGTVATLDIAAPLTRDNFEGLEAVPLANGTIRFYLLSDDNASPTQRTLLLAFDWQERGAYESTSSSPAQAR